MKVFITFDVEVWCGSWSELDQRFPSAFDRYCYGRSKAGDYALPKTLEILNANGLCGVFFVEPLFSARFGQRWLDVMVQTIQSAGQDVQLHLHPEWTDEISPAILPNSTSKRQDLTLYSEVEQSTLIAVGRRLLEAAKGSAVTAFRAGSFAANLDTYRALRNNGIEIDSSLNAFYDYSAGSIQGVHDFVSCRLIEGVQTFPVTVLRDGFGRRRAAQLNGCTFGELRAALINAERAGVRNFVIVSHNFEMLKPGSCDPDWVVVRRFEALCRFLSQHPDLFQVCRLPTSRQRDDENFPVAEHRPSVAPWLTAHRHFQQAVRRLG